MTKTQFLVSFLMITFLYSCKKEESADPAQSVTYPDYSQLKVGNYWIYQRSDVDKDGNETLTNIYDSCYVEKDTIINGKTYAKVFRPATDKSVSYSFLRDSLQYIIDSYGVIVFSSKNVSDDLVVRYNINEGTEKDTIRKITLSMSDSVDSIQTPSGKYKTVNANVKYVTYPKYVSSEVPNPRYLTIRYVKNIGIVRETLPFYMISPNTVERRLVRYYVQ